MRLRDVVGGDVLVTGTGAGRSDRPHTSHTLPLAGRRQLQ